MSVQKLEMWEHFFKPEVRSAGRRYFNEGKVSSSQPSDTEILSYIKASTSFKVSLKSPSVESEIINVDCTCPASRKGQFCKHIWAAFMKVEQDHPDFLESKSEIQKHTQDSESANSSFQKKRAENTYRPQPRPLSQAQIDSQAAYKVKQAAYRKEQYQRKKEFLKSKKQANKKSTKTEKPELPSAVTNALNFFSENGFPMETPFTVEDIRLAKKKLSQVFHPDIGGSHHEILELNKNFEVLIRFVQSENGSMAHS